MDQKKEMQISLAQKMIIKSILYPHYIVISNSFSFGRIYTTIDSLKNWVYSNLEGAIIVGLELKSKICKFFLFDLNSFEILFECEIYKKLPESNFIKANERFYYFQIDHGFIGFEIPNIAEASVLSGVVLNLTDTFINKTVSEYPVHQDSKFNELVDKAIIMFDKKLNENKKPKVDVPDKLIINEGELKKYINAVDLDEKNGKIIIKGSGVGGIDEVLKQLKGDLIVVDNLLKVGNKGVYEEQLSNNILTSYQKGILIPKRKIYREGVINTVKKNIPPSQSNTSSIPKVPVEPPKESSNIPKAPVIPPSGSGNIPQPPEIPNVPQVVGVPQAPNIPKPPTNVPTVPNNIPKPPTNIPNGPSNIPKPPINQPKSASNVPKPPTNIPKPPVNVPKPPSTVPVPNLSVPVPVVGNKGKVPPAPLIPKAPPIPQAPKVVSQPVAAKPKSTGKKLSLAEELAQKKGGLKKVEVKEYVSPALKKGDEDGGSSTSDSGSGGGGMMAELMKAMKNRGGKGPQPQPQTQNQQQPQAQTQSMKIQPPKSNIQPSTQKTLQNSMMTQPPKPNIQPPQKNIQPPKPNLQVPKPNIQPQVKAPSTVPVPNLSVPVPVVGNKGKVPPAPLIPKAPPIPQAPKVVSQPVAAKPKSTGKKLSLAEELAQKKGGLKKVEVKEYVSPALKKGDEDGGSSTSDSGSGGGGMMAELMKAMKNRGGKGPQPQPQTKPQVKSNIQNTQPSQQTMPGFQRSNIQNTNKSFQPTQSNTTSNTNEKLQNKFPTNITSTQPKVEPQKPKVETSSNISSNSQSTKFGGGGGFAAMRNMLANRMAPASTSSKPKEPSKPIVEVASSSTTGKMDINALISGMSKKMEGSSNTKTVSSAPMETPKVVEGKGKGIPPPPILLPPSKAPNIQPPKETTPKVPTAKTPLSVPKPKVEVASQGNQKIIGRGPQTGVPSVPSAPKMAPSVPQPKPPSSVPVPNITVPTPTVGGGKGNVPKPPPIPKAPPIPPVPKVNVPKATEPKKTAPPKKQLSMAEEIAKMKLKKVETQEKFGLKAQKESQAAGNSGSSSSAASGNSFFAQLSAVKLKKVGK